MQRIGAFCFVEGDNALTLLELHLVQVNKG